MIDIMYIKCKPVFHLVDEATCFLARQWLKNISAQHVWNQLRLYWIDIYLGPLDLVIADAGSQFMVKEFRPYAANIRIIIKNTSVEGYHFINMIEHYHGLQWQIYSIITKNKLLPKEQYLAQGAKGAYIASMHQPKASFNLFHAAQKIEFSSDNIAILNKRLQ